ncbi:MAG: nitroreductase/quinone reductase family protein [Actinomycetota bacterium]
MRDANVKRASVIHTILYRATNGLVGRRLVHNDMLLLTTTGSTTGHPHTVPLLYLQNGDRLIVVASYGGRPDHPQWYTNLVAEPEVAVQILGDHYRARASTMSPRERTEWWPRVVEAYDGYHDYQSKTTREIPLIWLATV